jgi:hypothetical protein
VLCADLSQQPLGRLIDAMLLSGLLAPGQAPLRHVLARALSQQGSMTLAEAIKAAGASPTPVQ